MKVVQLLGLGLWCIVVMPLFEPIKKEELADTLTAIGEVLRDKFNGLKLKYKDDVGWFRENREKKRCILYDLADLEEVADKDFVSQHQTIFTERFRIEEPAKGSNLFQAVEDDGRSH